MNKTPKPSRAIRGYHHLSRAWYAEPNIEIARKHDKSYIDEVTFGLYVPDGGCEGEMDMKWTQLGGNPTPCLRVFNDAWAILADLSDLLAKMKAVNDKPITPLEFCAMLDECGFKNLTATESPYA